MKAFKKLYLLPALLLIALAGCKKSSKNPCGGDAEYGGLNAAPVYVFYIKKDFGGGPITVTVKDPDGNTVKGPSDISVIRIYEPSGPVNPCNSANSNFEKRASFTLRRGVTYTYTASSDNKGWKGEINVPCEFESCNLVELQ